MTEDIAADTHAPARAGLIPAVGIAREEDRAPRHTVEHVALHRHRSRRVDQQTTRAISRNAVPPEDDLRLEVRVFHPVTDAEAGRQIAVQRHKQVEGVEFTDGADRRHGSVLKRRGVHEPHTVAGTKDAESIGVGVHVDEHVGERHVLRPVGAERRMDADDGDRNAHDEDVSGTGSAADLRQVAVDEARVAVQS